MRDVVRCRIDATATGLWLGLLVVGLWASGLHADKIRADAELGVSTAADEFPCLTITEDRALPADIAGQVGDLPPWSASSAAFSLWPRCLRAHWPVSRSPPTAVCPPCALHSSRGVMGTLATLITGGCEDISRGRQCHAPQDHQPRSPPVSGVS